MAKASNHERAGGLQKVKEFGFSPGVLKGALAEERKKK